MATTTTRELIPQLTLGWRMQMALRHAGVSVQEMADELGMSRSQLSRWLGDRGTPPRAAYVKLWALRCGVPYEWLAHGIVPDGWAAGDSNPEPMDNPLPLSASYLKPDDLRSPEDMTRDEVKAFMKHVNLTSNLVSGPGPVAS